MRYFIFIRYLNGIGCVNVIFPILKSGGGEKGELSHAKKKEYNLMEVTKKVTVSQKMSFPLQSHGELLFSKAFKIWNQQIVSLGATWIVLFEYLVGKQDFFLEKLLITSYKLKKLIKIFFI